jgi:glutathione S-transferase
MVEMTLFEKNLGFALERLSFARGEHKTPAMLALNPRGTIPVLTVGQAVLTETLAMLEYLDLTYAEPGLMGSDPVSRARALDRLHESAALKRIGMDLLAYLMRTPDSERDPEHTASGLAALRQELSWWQRAYSASAWAAGDSISLADISVFAYLATFVQLGLDLGELPALAGFHARMLDRPSVQATWPDPWKHEPPGDALAGQSLPG